MNTVNSDKEVVKLKAFVSERLTATPDKYDRVAVSINTNAKVLTTYKAELFSEWSLACQVLGRSMLFTQEELSRYIDMLVQTRVSYVQGKRVEISPTDRIAVPAYLSLVLSNVGLAQDSTQGIELYPEMVNEIQIDKEFMLDISRKIRILSNIGIEYADGYVRSRDGSFEFMSMALIDDYVRTWTKDAHPVYALLSSTLAIRGIEAVLSPRINYGSEAHMVSLVRHLAAVKG